MNKRATDANAIVAGREPAASSVNAEADDYNIALIKAMNWYSTHKDPGTARKYLVAAAKAG